MALLVLQMPKLPDEPLHRTNINLFAEDVEDLKRLHGWGWTEKVRELVRAHLRHKILYEMEEPEDE